MEIALALLVAGPLGYRFSQHRKGLWIYLTLAIIVLPIQTVSVYFDDPKYIDISYFVLNAIFIAVGVGLNRLGTYVRARRDNSRKPGEAFSHPSSMHYPER